MTDLITRLEEAAEGSRDSLEYIRDEAGRGLKTHPGQASLVLIQERADAILAALRPTDTGWRDIATAPKDGQSILAICGTAYSPLAGVTWWQEGWTHYSRPAEKWHGGVGKWFPTHWMPLPPAPTDTGRE